MPNWRKVIVSGSDAKLSSITVPGPAINQLTASVAITALNTYNSTALNSGTVQRFDTATASWYVEHNLNEFWPIVYVWQEDPDYTYTPVITDNIQVVSQNAIRINFPSASRGYVNVSRAGHVVSGSVEWTKLIGPANVTASINVYGNVIASEGFTGSLQGTASWANNAATSSYVLNAVSASFASTASYVNPLNQNVSISGSLNVSQSISASSLSVNNFSVSNTLGIGAQTFYAQGADGFSVNENFNVGGPTQTAYHFTSGDVNRTSVVFSLARTTQFTNMFGVTGSNTNNKFVVGSEYANTDFEWRSGLGVTPVNLQGGTLLARLDRSGSFWAQSISGSLTGSLFGTASWAQNAISASFTTTASYVLNAVSASFTSTASYVNPLQQKVTITGSLEVTGSSGNPLTVLSALQVTSSGYLVLPNFSNLQFADDAEAALAGVPIGGVYLNTGGYAGTQPFLTVRLT